LVPYVYFRFQLGPLCFKSFNLVPYVQENCDLASKILASDNL
jgi:hypothetical protein